MTLNFIPCLLKKVKVSKKLTFEKIFKKAERFAKKIKTKIHGNEIQYLILLRFIPMPYIVQNAILVLLNTSRTKFIRNALYQYNFLQRSLKY